MTHSRFEQYARIVAVSLLAFGCFLVLEPFLGAILFAGVLCLSTWPFFIHLRGRLLGRSWLAALLVATGQEAGEGVVCRPTRTAVGKPGGGLGDFLCLVAPGGLVLGALPFVLALEPMGLVFIWGPARGWVSLHVQPGRALFNGI